MRTFVFMIFFLKICLQSLSSQEFPVVDQAYMEGCKAILSGWDNAEAQQPFYDMFATWKNTSPNQTFLSYFDNNEGIISKSWMDASTWTTWVFYLTFLDGRYVDKKSAQVGITLFPLLDMNINQQNGTFTTKKDMSLTFYMYYGENDYEYQTSILGQLSVYFVDRETRKPVTQDEILSQNLRNYTVQLQFVSSDGRFSFITSLFSFTFDISTKETIFCYIFTVVYILVSCYARYTQSLGQRVSILSISLAFVSSSYIALWTILQLKHEEIFLRYVICFGFMIDLIKQFIFLAKKSGGFAFFFGICLLIINIPILLSTTAIRFPSFFPNFIPCIALLYPLFKKIKEERYRYQNFLTRFEICNWICYCLWISYAYLYPSNVFLLAPKPGLVGGFMWIIFIQFVVSLRKEMTQERREIPILSPLLRRNRFNVDDGDEEEDIPEHQNFKYTLFIDDQAVNQTLLADQCVICLGSLIGEEQKKLYKTPCGHIFHETCLRDWGTQRRTCPNCREKLPKFKRLELANPAN